MFGTTRALLACCCLMLTVGSIYTFSAFSGRLGELMNFDAADINLIGTAYNFGTWFGVVGGLLCDLLGPIRCVYAGATLCVVGSVCSALGLRGALPYSSFWFALYAFLFSQGSGWAYLAGMKQALRVTHVKDHGLVVGTMVCFVALSSGVMSQTYKCLLAALPLELYYLAVGALCASLQLVVTRFFPRDSSRHTALGVLELSPVERTQLQHLTMVAVSLSVWLLGVSLFEGLGVVTHPFPLVCLWLVTACHIAALPALGYWWRSTTDSHQAINTFGTDEGDRAERSLSAPTKMEAVSTVVEEPNSATAIVPVSRRFDDAAQLEAPVDTSPGGLETLISALQTVDFWLLICAIAGALSFPVTQLNNLSPLAESLRLDVEANSELSIHGGEAVQNIIAASVALFSVGNAWGRLSVGYLADRFSTTLRQPRWVWFLLACSTEILANLVLLFGDSLSTLYISIPLSGFGLGAIFSVAPIATSDMYTEKYFATMWGALTIAPCFTTEILGTLVAGRLADRAALTSQFFVHDHSYCLGTQCYLTTFMVTLMVEILATVAAIVLLFRLRMRMNAE